MSATVEFLVPAADSDAFNSAVYNFIEARVSALEDELAVLRSEPLGLVDRKTLTLWDDVAISDFVAFWANRRRSAA
jgi:hypothetical protein